MYYGGFCTTDVIHSGCLVSLRASSPIWASEASVADRSHVLARLASLAQIGELACRLYPQRSPCSPVEHDRQQHSGAAITKLSDVIWSLSWLV